MTPSIRMHTPRTFAPWRRTRFAVPRICAALFLLSAHVAFAQLALEPRLVQQEKWAEGDRPLQLKVLGGVKYDSNLFRLSDSVDPQATLGKSEKDDLLYWVGAGAHYDFNYSRQKFIVEAEVSENRFQNFDEFNNFAHFAKGEWKWEAGDNWDGNVGVSHRHYLPGFTEIQEPIKDMVDQTRIYGSANYLVYSRLKLTLDLDSYDEDHNADAFQSLDVKTNSAAFSVNWITPGSNTLGLRYRTADSRYTNQVVIAGNGLNNNYRDNEIGVVGHWFASGASDLRVRIGHVKREFDTTPNRDFSGVVWSANYHWEPPGKVSFDFAAWQDLAGFEDLTSNYAKTTGISAIPLWSITQTFALQAKAAYQSRKYLGDPGLATPGERREDKERLFQLAAIWTPAKKTNVTLSVDRGQRSSNVTLAEYDYWAIGAVASRTF